MNRRDMLRMTLASASLGGVAARTLLADEKRPELPEATPRKRPYWRGFNLPVCYRDWRKKNCSTSATSPTWPTWASTSSGSR